MDDEPREEVRDRGHIAVDPFDQLTCAVLAMERAVERQHVAREVGSQQVRRTPTEIVRDVRLEDGCDLRYQSDAQEQQRYPDEPVEGRSRLRLIDEHLGD